MHACMHQYAHQPRLACTMCPAMPRAAATHASSFDQTTYVRQTAKSAVSLPQVVTSPLAELKSNSSTSCMEWTSTEFQTCELPVGGVMAEQAARIPISRIQHVDKGTRQSRLDVRVHPCYTCPSTLKRSIHNRDRRGGSANDRPRSFHSVPASYALYCLVSFAALRNIYSWVGAHQLPALRFATPVLVMSVRAS